MLRMRSYVFGCSLARALARYTHLSMDAVENQRAVCREARSPFSPPPAGSTCGVALSTFDGRQPINALRHPPEGQTCGWYLWAGEEFPEANDAFSPIHNEHLAELAPELLPYLALAPGFRVLVAPDYADVWFDGSLLHI